VPAGALVLAVLPPMWDFATSGLETGLTFAWLGASYLLLVRRRGDDGGVAGDRPPDAPWWVPVVLGLGPLIRPDLTLYSALFLAVLLLTAPPGAAGRLRALGAALALPVAYEVFRMAYFANVVPNPALAKEAGEAEWVRGWAYVVDLAGPYLLAVPLLALALWAGLAERSGPRQGWRSAVVRWCPALGGLVHAVYIVRVGGDFMHARLLLPALFAGLAPVAVLPVARPRPVTGAAAAVVAGWPVLCAAAWRVPVQPEPGVAFPVVDERAYWNRMSADEHAITMEDHAELSGVARGLRARALAAQGADAYLPADPALPERALPAGTGVVLDTSVLGLGSTAGGPDVRALDAWGLAEAFGSRVERDPEARVGHQKALPFAYRLALFPELLADPPMPPDPDELAAAQRVVACPAVQRLRRATGDPLTPGRALANLIEAPALARLRIPRDPRTVTDCDQLG
jgi:arabinofuranosyltransferase